MRLGPSAMNRSVNLTSWTVRLLPYLEQTQAFEAFDKQLGAYANENEPVRKCEYQPFNAHRARITICNILIVKVIRIVPLSSYVGIHNSEESPSTLQ